MERKQVVDRLLIPNQLLPKLIEMKFSTTLLLLVLFSHINFAQNCEEPRYHKRTFEEINITRDIVYGEVNPYESEENDDLVPITLDFYEPVGDPLAQRPLVVMAFGGAFLFGEKEAEDMSAWCDSLAHRGYACASINYRIGFNIFSPRSAIRTVYRAVQDMRAAIRFLKEDPNNQGFKVDPDYIFAGGQSAGAITALHTAFLNEEADRPPETFAGTSFFSGERKDQGCLDCSGNNYEQSVEIKGLVSMWGALYLLEYAEAHEQIPTIMVHGTLDQVVPYGRDRPFNSPFFPFVNGSSLMQPRFDEVGIYSELYPYPNDASHTVYGSTDNPFPNENWNPIFNNTQNFLTTVMAYDSPTPSGSATAVMGNELTYSVEPTTGSTYCWSVTGGTIITDNGNEVIIEWTDASNGMVTVEEINYFDLHGQPASLAINMSDALPIELNRFSAFAKKGRIALDWTIATEWETGKYIIEKSNDGIHFHTIGQMTAKGNSTIQTTYEFVDNHPIQGINYYRLQIVDANNAVSFSEVRSVVYASDDAFLSYLFVDGQQLHLQCTTEKAQQISVAIFNISGQMVSQQNHFISNGNNDLKVNVNHWQRGSYIIKISTNHNTVTKKFIL